MCTSSTISKNSFCYKYSLNVEIVHFKTIQFGINTHSFFVDTQLNVKQFFFKQFSLALVHSSIRPIYRTLSGATSPGQSGTGRDGNKRGTPHSPKHQHYWSLAIQDTRWGNLTPLQRCSRNILQPQPTGLLQNGEKLEAN